jgi:hypothetical protein
MLPIFFVTGGSCTEHRYETVRSGPPMPNFDHGKCLSQSCEPPPNEIPWCDAYAVIRCSCQRCHTDPPQNGAPFPLLSYAATQKEYAGGAIWQHMACAVSTDFMPAVWVELDPPVEPLTSSQKDSLLGWLCQGARPTGGLDCGNLASAAGSGGAPACQAGAGGFGTSGQAGAMTGQ